MKHTKEPWKAIDRRDLRFNVIGWAIWQDLERPFSNSKIGDRIAITPDGSTVENEANAKRIALCVNACAGITNEALEEGIVKGCIEIIQSQTQKPDDGVWRWMNIPVYEEEK